MSDSLRFEPPGPQSGDLLKVIVRLGPDGKPIIDTQLSDSRRAKSKRLSRRAEGEMSLMREIVRLTIEAQRLAQGESQGQHREAAFATRKGSGVASCRRRHPDAVISAAAR